MQPRLSCLSSDGKSPARHPTAAETIEHAGQCRDIGSLGKAEQLYRRLLQDNPGDSAALHALGVLAHQAGNHHEAIELLNKAIAADPHEAQFHNTLGLIFDALGEFEQAVSAYQKAVSLEPDYPDAHHNIAISLLSRGQYAAALDECRQAVSLKPDCAEAYNTMGFCLEKQQQYKEAIESYERAVRLKPDFAEAYNHLGVVLNEQGRSAEAVENYRRALMIDPRYAEAYNNLGIALKNREEFAEAIWNFEQALCADPDFAEAHYNLANSLRDEGRCAQALAGYKRAILLNPDYAEAHWNMSLALLLNGDFIEGWTGYKWRRNAELKTITDRHCSNRPRWDGGSFRGKRLFVHYEQGLGDNIQFVSYLPMIKALGGTVIFETLRPLMGLLQGFPGIDELVEYCPNKKPSVGFDVYASLLDMPHLFGTTLETVPAAVPYIHADPAKAQYWRDVVAGPDFKVGIVWAGSSVHGNDRYRSCKLECFAPLTKISGVRLYGLQKGEAAAQMDELAGTMPVTNLSKDFNDFTDTAAAIENLDLVISVDTSVLHLAGAMAKPTWALLPFAPEWRWMLSRRDSPWYPTMKLFRQDAWNGWDGVFERVAEELSSIVDRRSSLKPQRAAPLKVHETIPAIIPYYKNKSQLARCISALEAQTVPVEIFIRDNSQDNVYYTAAINEGIRKYLDGPYKYLLALNQDVYLESAALGAMLAFMDSHPRCGIGTPVQLDSRDTRYVIFAGGGDAFPAGEHRQGSLDVFTEDEQISWANGACMILRKEMIRDIGLLDENFVFIGSDSDYSFTARSRGWQVWRIAGARGIHEQGTSGLINDQDIELLKVNDMIHFGQKWLTGGLYRELSREGTKLTTERTSTIMNELREVRIELERACRDPVVAG